jgi:hypothetical protein
MNSSKIGRGVKDDAGKKNNVTKAMMLSMTIPRKHLRRIKRPLLGEKLHALRFGQSGEIPEAIF